ncbi:phosphomevalonate kinase [Oceanobacillus piezotolerans]|uniref:phosphomevalonate kinase n=1 Tax=Oceanobacillus piezotolerans TaxID=2448030 RepID=A0A498D9Y7_9BACI|nr:phosphomevalonate kinase [Oceanobacillus piezotolerans]RLL41354.1 phosphomevalonate kinase [Oceanobacillus piezotolerans]
MPNTSIKVQVPGKLMIAGEFAVLEPYHELAVLAVNRYVYATLVNSEENLLTLHDFELENVSFFMTDNQVVTKLKDNRLNFIKDAIGVTFRYLREQEINISPFHLSVKSELDDESGVKYGLGSSAAVVTAVVSSILEKFMPTSPSKGLIFKLAALSHVVTQGNGSGADIAASSYGGLLKYASFQANWLQREYEKSDTITALTKLDWSYFSLNPVRLPDDIYFCVGWTGNAASTKKLVDIILQLKNDKPEAFQEFLNHSKAAVQTFFSGVEDNNHDQLFEGIKENRKALAKVGIDANVDIETPMLTTLCDLAEELGGAGKPSGAGGGDCGIAFMPSKEKAEQLIESWKNAGIKPLTIQPSMYGATVIMD